VQEIYFRTDRGEISKTKNLFSVMDWVIFSVIWLGGFVWIRKIGGWAQFLDKTIRLQLDL